MLSNVDSKATTTAVRIAISGHSKYARRRIDLVSTLAWGHLRTATKLRDHLLDLDLPANEDRARAGAKTLEDYLYALRR